MTGQMAIAIASLRRRANTRNVCFLISLRWSIHIIIPLLIKPNYFAIALPVFNDLGRSVTPIFRLMDHFLYRLIFLRLAKAQKQSFCLRLSSK